MVKIFVILDGIGDKPCKKLNGKTPLEAAKTPGLDFFASQSKAGYVYTVSEKIAPESDIAVCALLGYDPYKLYTGRGPLEAFGADLEVGKGDLCLRCNFATVNSVYGIVDRRVGRSLTTKEAKELEKTINLKVKLDLPFKFVSTIQHRGVLIVNDSGNLSSNISNVDPEYKKVGSFGVSVAKRIENKVLESKALDPRQASKISARVLNEFVKESYLVLNEHPVNIERAKKYLLKANIILPRDAGVGLPNFIKKKGWGGVVSMPLETGICKCAGINAIKFKYPEMKTRDAYENLYEGLFKTIKESLKAVKSGAFDSYYIHFKETDIPGHDGLPLEKKKMIEIIDKEFFSKLKGFKDVELIVTGDHSTPCEAKKHTADPVPLIYYKKGIKGDSVERFTERDCKKGSLGKMFGKDVLKRCGF